jgi:hypothetical protein
MIPSAGIQRGEYRDGTLMVNKSRRDRPSPGTIFEGGCDLGDGVPDRYEVVEGRTTRPGTRDEVSNRTRHFEVERICYGVLRTKDLQLR